MNEKKGCVRMNKTAVVYWSGTGNTEAMANAVAEGVKNAGGSAACFTPADFSISVISDYDTVAFGCPAMGAEVLEESEFEPVFQACKERLAGKKIALFGSYGWGDGTWMRNWEEECAQCGAVLVCDSVICQDDPDDEAVQACRELGAALV